MKNSNSTTYTPATINSIKFRIPLYQRPYAWEVLQIEQLLKDLFTQFNNDNTQKYFVGILNVGRTENNEFFDLIDGQQRITTLYLIGKVLSKYFDKWNEFLSHRLDLYGRKEDQGYLEKLDISLNPNPKMVEAIGVIEKFIELNVTEKALLAKYVYENAAFFISEVPAHYSLIEKNLQFVRMNNRGKQLESHDVLKIKLASEITDAIKRTEFLTTWNTISQLGCGNASSNISEEKSLQDILEDNSIFKEPEKDTEIFYQSIVTFPEFLLIALARFFKRENLSIVVSHQKDKKDDAYRKDRLLEEFGFGEKKIEFKWTEENTLKFIKTLHTQFNSFDKYIIKRDKEEKYKFSGDKEKFIGSFLAELQVFQSFLYVTREPYQNNWLIDTFDFLEETINLEKIETLYFLNFLKKLDNDRCKTRNSASFSYLNIDRYWFWRLDYYLWENRNAYFTGRSLEIANKYVFRVNRSVEHVAPQTPKSKSNININKALIDSFGNLAMISSGQNSSLQNEAFEQKWAHVMSFINGSISGSIESLKMLKMYEFENWNDENLKIHNDIMINVLIDSFPDIYLELKDNLKTQLFKNEN